MPRQLILEAAAARPRLEVRLAEEADLAAALTAMAGRGFDLSCELPLRAHLFALDGSRAQASRVHGAARACCLWCCITSPATAGRWVRCRGILRRSTGRACAGVAAELAPLAVQYADYTLWQQAVLGDEDDGSSVLSRQLVVLEGDAGGPAGADRSAGRPAAAGGCEPSRRAGAAAARCRSAPRAGGAGAGQRARACSWCCRRGLRGCCRGLGPAPTSPSAARSPAAAMPALDELIGFFVNTLVLRTDTVGQPELQRAAGAGARRQPCGLWPCRSAVRAAGRGAQSGAVAVAASAVPGDAGVRGGARRTAGSSCRGLRCGRSRWRPRARSSTCRSG